ncbi:MAG: DUF4403 family protein [Gemmatimonadaceae bacterium]
MPFPAPRAGRGAPWLALGAIALATFSGVSCDRRSAAVKDSLRLNSIAEAPLPSAELSQFDVPLQYDFTPVLAIVERVVPKTFGSLDSVKQVGDDNRKHYAFEATRGPFTAFAQGTQIHLHATLSYSVKAYYKPIIGPTIGAGCGNGDERPTIIVELVTPLTLKSNWHFQSAAKLERLAPASDSDKDRCKVSILHYDVTDRVVEAAKTGVTSHLSDIDAKIGMIDLSGRAAGWWELLNRPIHLADSVWLMLQPRQIRVGRVTGDGHTLTVRAGLDAQPKIVTGLEPVPLRLPLPPVGRDSALSGFRIEVDGLVDYATATRAITEALRGKEITEAGRSVTVDSIFVSPQPAGKLGLTVQFTGDTKGHLRLAGTPKYDPVRNVISVPDLNYDLTTNDRLISAYAWLRSDALRTLFRDKASIPVAPVTERGKTLLLAGLNRTIGDVMTLSATVDSVAVHGLYVTRKGLVVRAGASGTARVSVSERTKRAKTKDASAGKQ